MSYLICKTVVDMLRKDLDHELGVIACESMADEYRGTATAAYLFAQSTDNEPSVLNRASQLYSDGYIEHLLLCGAERIGGYEGFTAWRRMLAERGVDERDISPIPVEDPEMSHTHLEAKQLSAFLGECADPLFVIAAPFHQLRAFMNLVTFELGKETPAPIYNRRGFRLDWHAQAVHSQGILQGRRLDLIDAELDRITHYQEQGDIASAPEVLAYMQCRPMHALSANYP